MAGDGIDSLDAKGAEQKEATELLCLLLNLPHNLGMQETVDLITNVVIFMRAHVALREDNEFMLLLCSSYGPVVLYHPSESEDVEVIELQSGSRNLSYARFEKAQDSIMAALKRLNDTVSSMSDFGNNSNEAKGGSGMANGVAKALCYVNKKRLMTVEAFNARILIVTAGAKQEDSKNYISLMNCIFSCQKMNVPLDVCIVETSQDDKGPSKRGSVFMEQAVYITNGNYRSCKQNAFLQTLLTHFLFKTKTIVSESSSLKQVDLRATCFCHTQENKIVDVGYICSICLSIFCEPLKQCETCGYEFNKD